VAGGSNGGVNGFNTIDGGEVKRGIKGGLERHPRVELGGQRRRGEVATAGRRGEGDGADRRAPHGNDVRERRRLYRSAQCRRIRLSANTPTRLGPSGPSGEPAACGA
jgi:hypothetical protein